MDFRWLEDFISVANTCNFSASAEKQNITQSTLSRRIISLEEWLGTSLIDRSIYPVALTHDGHRFRETAEQAVQALHLARSEFRKEQSTRRATLGFAALHSIALTFFPHWISILKKELDLGSTRMIAGNLHEIVESFVNGNCDYLICYSHPAVPVHLDPALYPAHILTSERLVPVCATDQKRQPLFKLNKNDGTEIPFLAFSSDAFHGPIIEQLLVEKKLKKHLKIVHEDPMGESLKRIVLEGAGMSWLPRSIIATELEAGTLTRCADRSHDINLDIILYRSMHRRRTEVSKLWSAVTAGTTTPNGY